MLQIAFWPSCMNRTSVFARHKRFKEGRESVRDDDMCGRSKEVRTTELIGQIKNFLDKDCRVSIETVSAQFDVNVGTVHSFIREELKMQKISLSQGCSEKIRRKDVVMTAGRWSSWSIHIPQFLVLWWPVMKAGSTAMTQRPRDRVPIRSMLALPVSRWPDRANPPTNFWWSLLYSTGMIYMHWVPTGQTVNKEYYVAILREFRKRFRRKKPPLFTSGQWHFHQDNAPVNKSIPVTVYLTKMGFNTVTQPLYSPDLASYDFWLFPKLRGCRYETIEEMKEALTKVIDTLTQDNFHGSSRSCWKGKTSALQSEEITSKGTRVSCVYY